MKDVLSGIRKDGTIEGTMIETHYRPCKGIISDGEAKCLRVFVDENGFDIETRVLYDTLIKDGWTPPNALSVAPSPPALGEDRKKIREQAIVAIVENYLRKCAIKYPDGSSAEDIDADLLDPLDKLGSITTAPEGE